MFDEVVSARWLLLFFSVLGWESHLGSTRGLYWVLTPADLVASPCYPASLFARHTRFRTEQRLWTLLGPPSRGDTDSASWTLLGSLARSFVVGFWSLAVNPAIPTFGLIPQSCGGADRPVDVDFTGRYLDVIATRRSGTGGLDGWRIRPAPLSSSCTRASGYTASAKAKICRKLFLKWSILAYPAPN